MPMAPHSKGGTDPRDSMLPLAMGNGRGLAESEVTRRITGVLSKSGMVGGVQDLGSGQVFWPPSARGVSEVFRSCNSFAITVHPDRDVAYRALLGIPVRTYLLLLSVSAGGKKTQHRV